MWRVYLGWGLNELQTNDMLESVKNTERENVRMRDKHERGRKKEWNREWENVRDENENHSEVGTVVKFNRHIFNAYSISCN